MFFYRQISPAFAVAILFLPFSFLLHVVVSLVLLSVLSTIQVECKENCRFDRQTIGRLYSMILRHCRADLE